jgi:hypothetical protein
MLKHLYSIYQKINILSIDVVLGAVLSAVFANSIFAMDAKWWYYWLLALSVWSIYTLDHLIDAFKNKENTSSKRHLFYYVHSKIIVLSWSGINSILVFLLILFVDRSLIVFGVTLGFSTLIYLSLVYFSKSPAFRLPKEFLVALIYTAGIWYYPMSFAPEINFMELLFPFLFFLLVLFVLLLYSYVDLEIDIQNMYYGIFAFTDRDFHSIILRGVLLLEVVSFVLMVYFFPMEVFFVNGLIFLLMIVLNIYLYLFGNALRENGLYRFLGEFVFYIPGIVIGVNKFITFVESLF